MRQLRLLALLAPALFLLPIACEDSSSSTSPPFTFEAGPGFEAGPPAEAGPLPDGGVDAADVFVPPAPKGVTVTVIDGLAGKADVRVISHDATGAVIGDQKTDATGKLTIATAPSIVTVLATANSAPIPVTYFAVADGDNLVVRIPSSVVGQVPIGQYSVTFTAPAVAPIPTATVVAGNGCTGSSTDTSAPILVDLLPSCVGAANAVLADGTDVNSGRFFAFKRAVAKPAAVTPAVDVMLGAWTAPGVTTFDTVNRSAATTSLNGDLYMIANGAAFLASGSGSLGDGGKTNATATGFAEAYQTFVRADNSSVGRFSETAIVQRAMTTAPASLMLPNVDLANALPYITAAAIDSTAPARPIVTLTSAPLTVADGGYAALTWLTAADSTGTWTFVLPASAAATFTVPALPADAVSFAPLAPTNIEEAVFFEATQVPGYKETKAFPVTPTTRLDLLNGSIPLPADGTVRITTLGPPS